jgi:hypothetical protein
MRTSVIILLAALLTIGTVMLMFWHLVMRLVDAFTQRS